MAQCEVCGNNYDKAFEVRMGGETHIFDSFECAIQALAPTCAHCGNRIIGHGMEADGYSTVARTAPRWKANPKCKTAPKRAVLSL